MGAELYFFYCRLADEKYKVGCKHIFDTLEAQRSFGYASIEHRVQKHDIHVNQRGDAGSERSCALTLLCRATSSLL